MTPGKQFGRSYLGNTKHTHIYKPGVVVHTYNPNTHDTEAEESQI
jgi:hypothetical protein